MSTLQILQDQHHIVGRARELTSLLACVRAETPAGLAAAALQWLGDAEAAGVAGRAAHAWACEHLAPRAVAAAQLAALRGLLPGSAR